MGLVCSQARLLMLTDRKSSLEFRMQCITNRLMTTAALTSGIASQQSALMTQLSSGSASKETQANVTFALQAIEAKMAQVNAWEKLLETEMKQIETQHTAVQNELEAVKKLIDKNCESFKYFQS